MEEYFLPINLLLKEITIEKLSEVAASTTATDSHLPSLNQVIDKLYQEILNQLSRIHNNELARNYVHDVQWELNNTIETFLNKPGKESLGANEQDTFNSICLRLTDLIDLITRRFVDFLNPATPLPYTYSLMAGKKLENSVRQIRQELTSSRINKQLLEITIRPISERAKDPAGITYRELIYFSTLCENLLLLKKDPPLNTYTVYDYQVISTQLKEMSMNEQKINVMLHILLLHFNFNSPEYITFCIANLQDKLNLLPTENDRTKVLRLYLKLMNQVILRPGFSLNAASQISASKQIRKWVEQEINYLPAPPTTAGGTAEREKIDTSLSSAELAVFIDVFIEGKIITNTNKSKVFRIIASLFNTLGSDNISPNTLRSKSVNKKDGTIEKVRQRFWNCYNILRAM
ncbi:hypothetical protein PV783_13865 [Chitinophaga sp. CC14]|uniref:hypothetical protein n=1 Tax=Chitinophaga sp. CC14 TaxID=3029199 RepID=UPI003B7D95F6